MVGQPDAVGGLVEGVAGRVHGRGVHRQDDGRLAARAHLGRKDGNTISATVDRAKLPSVNATATR